MKPLVKMPLPKLNVLGIVLTARNNGSSKIELAGFPHHALGNYLPKLVRSGLRVGL